MSKLWAGVLAVIGFLVSALLLVVGQKNRAKEKYEEAVKQKDSIASQRKSEKKIQEARHEVRQKTKATKERHSERDSSTRPKGSFRAK